ADADDVEGPVVAAVLFPEATRLDRHAVADLPAVFLCQHAPDDGPGAIRPHGRTLLFRKHNLRRDIEEIVETDRAYSDPVLRVLVVADERLVVGNLRDVRQRLDLGFVRQRQTVDGVDAVHHT